MLLLAIVAIAIIAATAIFAYGLSMPGNALVSFSEPSSEQVAVEAGKATDVAQKVLSALDDSATVTPELIKRQPGNVLVWQFVTNNSETWINAQTGRSIFVFNGSRLNEAQPGPVLGKAEVEAAAKTWADKLGLSVPATSPVIDLRPDAGGIKDNDKGYLTWPRVFGGITFRDEWVKMEVSLHGGDLVSYHDNSWSDAPPTTEPAITAADAKASLADLAKTNGFTLGDVRLLIVSPNYQWTAKSQMLPDKQTRLAWAIDFAKKEGAGQAWVDAVDGSLLGGEQTK